MEEIKAYILGSIVEIGFNEESIVYSLFDTGLDFVPYLSKIIQIRKINRLENRLKEHQVILSEISTLLMNDNFSLNFIKERVFPIVLEDLIEEHEGLKIKFVLEGFKNVLNEYSLEESEILALFDTLRGVRIFDLQYLFRFDLYSEVGKLKNEYIREQSELVTPLEVNTIYKLIRFSLIRELKVFTYGEDGKTDVHESGLVLTSYGKRFCEFLKS